MFLLSRPSQGVISDYLKQSRDLPLSYGPVGLFERSQSNFRIDEASGGLGFGAETFERAKIALTAWRHFDLGWIELFPRGAAIEPEVVVAVLIRHLGIWSLNGCRLVYTTGDADHQLKFGFAYGTLTNHAEMGEELFEVAMHPQTKEVTYRIRAASKPRALLAQIGYPCTRLFQARFRSDSIAAMQRAVRV